MSFSVIFSFEGFSRFITPRIREKKEQKYVCVCTYPARNFLHDFAEIYTLN